MIRVFANKRVSFLIVLIGVILTSESSAQRCGCRHRRPEQAPPPIFPVREQDEVWVLSTRAVCPTHFQPKHLQIKIRREDGWETSDINSLVDAHCQNPRRTIIYCHGNRQNRSWGEYRGLQSYCLLFQGSQCPPVRYIVWDWPSEDHGRMIRAYIPTVKRAAAEGFAVAWFLNQLEHRDQISLLGYSLGTQVLVSALENSLLHFGSAQPYRFGVVAPVTACRWPQCQGQLATVYQKTESLKIVYSSLDHAVRFYRAGCSFNKYCGQLGVERLFSLDVERKICQTDVANSVGDSHGIHQYFSAPDVARPMAAFLVEDCDCLLGEGNCACRSDLDNRSGVLRGCSRPSK